MKVPTILLWSVAVAFSSAALANEPLPSPGASLAPDPATVQRFEGGYRYPQAGWIVLHLEGDAYERGLQHGRLLAPEIAGYVRCYAKMQSPEAPSDGWKLTRTIANTTFLRGFDREYLEEMKGIADGASAAGARFDDRAIDLVDIAALNLWPELMTLDGANDANPTGMEGIDFPSASGQRAKPEADGHCSAFAATGKATRDGHAVIGHITMFSLYPTRWYNVWLDIKPEQGHRLTMQSYPGGIYSGMDYYLNGAGIAMVETTIEQTRFNAGGKPLASRVRRAMQYADSIDQAAAILREGNNGLYNNEWLLADMKTDEIAMLELGTQAAHLWRSGKNEWYGGTEGFYWGCNNAKDLAMRMETIPAVNDRPANLVWYPTDRDLKWQELYRDHVGRIDEAFGKIAFTTAPLCSSASVDAKFTTAALAREMKSWALFGPPLERTWLPTPDEMRMYHDIQPLVSNPWTVLGRGVCLAPSQAPARAPVDLHDPFGDHVIAGLLGGAPEKEEPVPPTKPAWHGTILPASDADLWLASAFAEYEGLVSLEKGYAESQTNKCLCNADYDKVARSLFAARARYFSGVRKGGDIALSAVKWDPSTDVWYKIASGKGVLILAELRRMLGDECFTTMMDDFGRSHAGKPCRSEEFTARASKAAKRDLSGFFQYWLHEPGLPRLTLISAQATADTVHGKIEASGGLLPSNIEITVESSEGEKTEVVTLDAEGNFQLKTLETVTRLVVDKYARAARANGSETDLESFADDVRHTLIVYGTRSDEAANREAADACQKAIRSSWYNIDLPIKTDRAVSEADLRSGHLILIGRPDANWITERMRHALPVTFGPNSFDVRAETYANASSAVLVAGVNPENRRYSVVVIAGNSAAATLAHAGELGGRAERPEVRIYDASGKPKSLVVPAPELTKTFDTARKAGKS